MKQNIDYSIIWKKIHGELSEKEQISLDDWVNSSQEHRDYYNNALKYYSEKESHIEVSTSSLTAMKSRLDFTASRHSYKWYYAVAACGLILVSSLLVWHTALDEENKSYQVSQESLEIGNSVVLITSKGTEIELSKDGSTQIDDEYAEVSSVDNGLKYDAKQTGDNHVPVDINTLIIPRGESFNLELADGTKVWLNSESVLKYPSKFQEGTRKIELTGEAYFEVAKDEDNPFVLTSQSQTITVLGTAFNLTAYPDEPNLITTLVEGSVKVENKLGSSQILTPNDQSVLDKESGYLSKRAVDVQKYISWKGGIIMFEDLELVFILQKLSRWYDVELFYENDRAARKKFTGQIKRYDEVSKILDMLKTTGTVDFKVSGNAVIVK